MLNRALSILLTAMIVACPCVCRTAGAGRAPEHAEVHCHCFHADFPQLSHDEQLSTSDDASQPTSDHHPSSDNCGHQCICKGAVVDDGAQFDIGLDTSWWEAVALSQPMFVDASESRGGPFWIAWPPDDGANLGRTLRCRYESFLC